MMIRRLLAACAGLALLHAPALAATQYIGVISMYLCDNGEDLCSNKLISAPVFLPIGLFTEIFVFDFVNRLPDVPDNVPLLEATAFLGAAVQDEFISASVQLYNSSGRPIGINYPPLGSFVGPTSVGPWASNFVGQA